MVYGIKGNNNVHDINDCNIILLFGCYFGHRYCYCNDNDDNITVFIVVAVTAVVIIDNEKLYLYYRLNVINTTIEALLYQLW